MATIEKLVQSNIYLDGKKYLGQAEEITVPEVQAKMIDHKAVSSFAEVEVPGGLQKMSCTIKWNGPYSDALTKSLNVYKPIRLQVRGNVQIYEGTGLQDEVPIVAYLTVQAKKLGSISLKSQENSELESEFNCLSYKLEKNGKTLFEIDVINQIFIVDGVDMLSKMRRNIGM